jgi:hypothetical protein
MRRRLLPFALLAAVAMVLAGCGKKTSSLVEAQTEGLYMDVGPLLYQVQISRYLNPADPEDETYLTGLPAGVSTGQPRGETWFGVFMRVQNVTKQTHTPTTQFVIRDTRGQEYRPIPLDAKVNPFAYVASPVAPGGVNPGPETAAANGPVQQGSLILFRLKVGSLQNRPLQLRIEGGAGEQATIALDL